MQGKTTPMKTTTKPKASVGLKKMTKPEDSQGKLIQEFVQALGGQFKV